MPVTAITSKRCRASKSIGSTFSFDDLSHHLCAGRYLSTTRTFLRTRVVGPVGPTLPRSSTSNATLRFASREVGAGVSAQSNPPAHSESGCRHAALECLAAISGEIVVTYEKPV